MNILSHELPVIRHSIKHFAALLAIAALMASAHRAEGAQSDPSYGRLANEMLCGAFDEIVAGLTNFNAGTLPHEAKELRKQLGRFRNRLDLFAFAYPTGPGKDPYLKLREDVDKGYERMGDFKDLFDGQRLELAEFDPEKEKWSKGIRPEDVTYPDAGRVNDRRGKVLKWHAKFMEADRLAAYRAYICAPDLERFHGRSADDLSRFFWGSEEGLTPRRDLSGLDNFRWLTAELLERAGRDYDAVQELRSLEGDTAEKFHDFRKRVRAVVKITEDIELLPKGNKRAGELHELMDDLDDGYGDVNDLIVDLELAVESGDAAEMSQLREEIARDWTALRQWQTDHEVPASIAEYAKLLRSLIDAGKQPGL
ncbi:MAG TPA: hypothetical protein DCY13_09735 [Verrucomicrobiales bacterium]|nr:hypothetical protein [Verrucomicrobiales bacterium]